MLDATDARIVAGLLIAGFFVFLTGAVRWSMRYQASQAEMLQAIAESKARWRWIHVWMVAGVAVTLLGSGGLAFLLVEAGGHVYSLFGFLLFATGALPWLTGVAWRLTALQQAALSGEAPPDLKAWLDWFGIIHTLHLVSAYLSWVLIGVSVLDTGILAEWVGWLGVGLGAFGAAGYVAMKGGPFAPPILAHLYTLIVGVALLVRWA